ncbi:MAG: TldD/PmbA family protein, partial [Candidatus Hodarchaeales archaeon]
ELLSELAHKTIAAISKKNEVKKAEAFFAGTQNNEIMIRDSEIQTKSKINDLGVGFRVVVPGNRVGFACSNKIDDKSISKTVKKALAIAKVSSEDQSFALPEATQLPSVIDSFDSRIFDINAEEIVDIAKRAIAATEAVDKRVIAKWGQISFFSGWRGVINTLGIDAQEQETKAAIYLEGSGQQDSEVTGSSYDVQCSRRADLNPEEIGEKVGRSVVQMFGKQSVSSFEGTAIFGPAAVAYQLIDVLIDGLKGTNITTGSSAWTKSLEQEVASKNLSITDDGLLANGFASRSFDDEGAPSQCTHLIEKGILRRHLHCAASANALNTANSSNASRYGSGFDMTRMIIGNGYRTKPEIYPSNLTIIPGNKTQEELVAETEKGVLVEFMTGFPQRGSGIISAQLARAFYVENGELKFPIKDGMLSGIAFDWFHQISGVGNNVKRLPNAVIPSIRVEGAKIIGS